MDCLKCGKKTTDEQVFCDTCLASMDAYPVKPDVHIQLPNRPEVTVKKAARKRRVLSYEEATVLWRKRTKRLAAAVLVLIVLLGAAVFLLVKGWLAEDALPVGQDLTTEQTQG
jgi:hypothetical protein